MRSLKSAERWKFYKGKKDVVAKLFNGIIVLSTDLLLDVDNFQHKISL